VSTGTADFEVVSVEELERRALERERASWQLQVQRHQALENETQAARAHYGDRISSLAEFSPGRLQTSADYSREAARLAAHTATSSATFRREISAARADAISVAILSAVGTRPIEVRSSHDIIAERRTSGQPISRSPMDISYTVPAAVQKALCRLDADVDAGTLSQVEALASAVVRARSGARAATLLRALQDDVLQANRVAEHARRVAVELTELEAQLEGLSGPAAASGREALQEARRSGARPTDDLRATVAGAVAAERAEADRVYAIGVAVSCFEELGYAVDEGFETETVSRGMLHARNTRWPGYALRIRGTMSGDIGFHVVRQVDTPADLVREREVEEEFCTDFEHVRRSAAARGVHFRMKREDPPGTWPMIAAVPEQLERGRSTRAAVQTDRAKGLDS